MKGLIQHMALIAVSAAALLTSACSSGDQFRVNGTIKGNPTMNLRAGYYADGRYRTVITGVREGKFEFFGSSGQPGVLELTDNEYRPLGRLYVQNGENFDISIDPADPYAVEASGNDVTSRWVAFLRDNADALRSDLNGTVAAYVGSHPADVLSAILMVTTYDSSSSPSEADSLLSLIEPQARPSSVTEGYAYVLQRLLTATDSVTLPPVRYVDMRDSVMEFGLSGHPLSLVAISETSDIPTDSVLPVLRRLHKRYKASQLSILDFSTDADTSDWRSGIRTDSVKWTSGWSAGGIASPALQRLAPASVPCFVLTDSTGREVFRSVSASEVERKVKSLL
ncbi:MAG: hypothetical protein K2J38_03705 [Muribaculaceae bacterium]|nr:hypothetical protein [Muribaculaceae bacterium]